MTPAEIAARPKGTRMWGVVTPRGKVLGVGLVKADLADYWRVEIKYHGAKIVRVRAIIEKEPALAVAREVQQRRSGALAIMEDGK